MLLTVVTLYCNTPAMRIAMVWHCEGVGKQHQVSSLTVADGMHNLGDITSCSWQFELDSVFVVLQKLLFDHNHFNGTRDRFFFFVGNFEYVHRRFDLCYQGSCLLLLIIGYWESHDANWMQTQWHRIAQSWVPWNAQFIDLNLCCEPITMHNCVLWMYEWVTHLRMFESHAFPTSVPIK
jgi:hypothetical protein